MHRKLKNESKKDNTGAIILQQEDKAQEQEVEEPEAAQQSMLTISTIIYNIKSIGCANLEKMAENPKPYFKAQFGLKI